MSDRVSQAAFEGEDLDRLIGIFTPFVMKAVSAELNRRLSEGISLAQIDAWIKLLDGYKKVGRFKKAIAAHLLKKKRKQIVKGKKVTLSDKEHGYLMEKAENHLPPRLVRTWLDAVDHGREKVNDLASLDDAMLPPDARFVLYAEEFKAFGVSDAAIKDVLREVRASTGGIPEPAVRILTKMGLSPG